MLILHLLAAGAWLGCVLVEAVVESMQSSDSSVRRIVADLHYRTDLLVEIPLIALVVITGVAQFDPMRFSGWYALKVVLGSITVVSNLYCVLPVMRRQRAAQAGRWEEATRQDQLMLKAGYIVIPSGIATFAVAAYGLMAAP
ncbi:MAG: hypothetical protein JRH16_22525 [Deltaproteobacteria bacterium]|nr:hypothetical protein [Deltaproteobacteria bacterium]